MQSAGEDRPDPSLKSALPLLVLAATAPVLGVFLWIAYHEVERTVVRVAGERAQTAADQIIVLFGPGMAARHQDLLSAAADASIRAALQDPSTVDKAAVADRLRGLGNPASAELWTAGGELLVSLTAGAGTAVTFERAPASGWITEVVKADSSTFSQTVVEVTGNVAGAPGTPAPVLGYLVVRRAITLTPPDLFERLVGAGAVLMGSKRGGNWTTFRDVVPAPVGDLDQARAIIEYQAADGSRRIGALSEIRGTPWTILVGYPKDVVLAPARQFTQRASIAALVLIAVAMLLGRLLTRRVTAPLIDLSRAATAMAGGDYSLRVNPTRRDEVGQLGHAFNTMAEHVATAQRELEAEVQERKQAADALLESERLYRSTFDEAPVGISHTSLDGRFLRVNARLSALLGYEPSELLAVDRTILLHPDELLEDAEGRRLVLDGGVEQFVREGRLRTRTGTYVWVAIRIGLHRDRAGRPAYFIATVGDVSERRRLEEQLRQAQKMEAIGRLAGGVAHDFNNLLTGILGFTAMLLDDLPSDNPIRSDIVEIKKAGESAAALTKQLLAFSRRQILSPEILDLNGVVRRVDGLLQRVIGEDIDLVVRLGEPLDRVLADAGQVEQIVMNLAVNARDAMPIGGKLTIETSTVELDQSHVSRHPGARDGPHVMLAISDTGVGMSAETQARIFEPFFTTKKRGEGTGLGLATVYGIVKQSGGWIWVYSEIGQGTTFKVYFPATSASPGPEARSEPVGDLAGDETILIAEDQREVRLAASAALRRLGYKVLEASSGAEALAIAHAHEGPIQLLLTDVVMPAMSGRELAEAMKSLRPSIRVLYASGYADDAIVRHGVLDGGLAFIQKPFTPQSLGMKVREVLNGSA